MRNDQTVRGTNFTCFHAGPKEAWTQYRLEPPAVPRPARGKLFLRGLLGSAGLELSLNVVPPGQAIPFLHRHRQNDEVYVVVGGRGQFLVDGECIDVQEGSVLCLRPAAARAWRSHTDEPLYFLCIQYWADSQIEGGTADGQKVEGEPAWPNGRPLFPDGSEHDDYPRTRRKDATG
jgi:mannose-6-phosphate isomerase-like protein (cupin superfamily)